MSDYSYICEACRTAYDEPDIGTQARNYAGLNCRFCGKDCGNIHRISSLQGSIIEIRGIERQDRERRKAKDRADACVPDCGAVKHDLCRLRDEIVSAAYLVRTVDHALRTIETLEGLLRDAVTQTRA